MDALDLNSIQKTELLASTAAKDKIMIKPKRSSTRLPRQKNETNLANLRSLSEDAILDTDVVNSNLGSGTKAKSLEKISFFEERPLSLSNKDEVLTNSDPSPGGNTRIGNRPNLSSTNPWRNNRESPLLFPSSPVSPPALSSASQPSKATTPTSPKARFPQASDVSPTPNLENMSDSKEGINDKATEVSMETVSVSQLTQRQKELEEMKSEIDIKSRLFRFQTPGSNKTAPTSSALGKQPLKVAASDSVGTLLTKDEKPNNWGNNKSSPSPAERALNDHELNSGQIQRSRFIKNQENASKNCDKSVTSPTTPTLATSAASRPDSFKFGASKSAVSPTCEPSWMNSTRKKKEEQESYNKDESSKVNKPAASPTNVKTVFTSNYLDKKQNNSETISKNQPKMSMVDSKKWDNSQTSDSKNNTIKLPCVETISHKMDATGVNAMSVKVSRSIFSSGAKFTNETESVKIKNMASDNFRTVPGSSSASSSSTSKSFSGTNQTTADGATSGPADGRSVPAADGIIQPHDSLKSPSSIRNQETIFQRRGGNFIKGSTTLSPLSNLNQSPCAAASASINKTGTTTKTNIDNSGASSTSAVRTQTPSTAQILPSQTSVVTIPSFALNVISFYGDKSFNTSPSNTAIQKLSPTTSAQTFNSFSASVPKSVSNSIGFKSAHFSGIKLSSDISSTVSPTSALLPSPVSPTSNTSPSSSSFSKPHSYFSSTAFKPHTPSPTTSYPLHTPLRSPTIQQKEKSSENTTTPEKNSKEDKTDAPAKIPLWRANLNKTESKLENKQNPYSGSQQFSQNRPEIVNKNIEKEKTTLTTKKTETISNSDVIMQADVTSGKPSKVLDMIKNFQNVKIPS